jgi:hypothetical protein
LGNNYELTIYMKEYPKIYENVYTSDRTLKKCQISKVSADGMNIDEYIFSFRKILDDYESFLFDYWVKIEWLVRKFRYNGKGRKRYLKIYDSSLDLAYGLFIRNYLGHNMRLVVGIQHYFNAISSYFNSFFPDFNEGNPFKNKYEYPYKYMNIECLFITFKMEERLDLLKHGEENKMTYIQFLDYVLNYINCYNEEHGITYLYVRNYTCLPYIKVLK